MSILRNAPSRYRSPRSVALGAGGRVSSAIEPLESRIAPAVVLGITDHADTVTPGGTLTYAINYTNNGDALTGVVLADSLPAGTSFDPAENPGWTNDSGILHFAVGDLASVASGQATLILHVNSVAPAALASIQNNLTLSHAGSTTSDAQASDSTTLNAVPDLSVTKTRQGEGAITPGSSISYNITFANPGNQNATGVVLTEHLPAGTSFDPGASSEGWVETAAGSGIFKLTIGAVAGGGVQDSRIFAVKVTNTVAAGKEVISNVVDIADDGTNGTDPNTANNTGALVLDLDAAPDLSLTKTTQATSTAPGGQLTFSFSYGNTGNQNSAGAFITDTLPSYATFDAGLNPGWTLDGTTLKFAIGGLNAGATGSTTLKLGVAAKVAAGVDQFTNTATIADDGTSGADSNLANNTSSVSVPLDASPDLVLTKTDGRDTAHAGQVLTYTFNYNNAGTQGATGVSITDMLPSGTSFDPALNPGWTFDSGTGVLTFAVGNVNAGSNGTATLVLKVGSELPQGMTSLTNTASIADDGANGADLTPGNNTSTDSDFIVNVVDLNLSKTSDNTSVAPGGALTYHLNYGNAGDLGASGVIITDVLPAGTTFSAVDNPGWTLVGNTLTYTVGDVAAGGSGNVTLILGVVSTAPAGLEQIANTASIADDGSHGTDFAPADNTATKNVPLDASADLHLTKTNNGATVTPSSSITYDFAYGNSGNQGAAGVVINDPLPAGLTFNADVNPGWTLTNGTLFYNIGSLAPGAEGTAHLILAVAASAPAGATQITNTATIGDDGHSGTDGNLSDNTATANNPLDAHADLVLALSAGASSVAPFGQLNYTLSYSNAGNQTMSNVVLTEHLPAGTTFNAGNSTAGWTMVSPGVYQLTVSSLAGAASGSAIFAVNVNGPVAAGLENLSDTASISGAGTDSNPDNNTPAPVTTAVNAAPNLAVTQTASSTSISRGGLITYSITYANVGNQAATGAFLTETLPDGLTFVADGSSAGWTSTTNGDFHYDIGNLGVGQSVTVTFQARASSTIAPGSHPQNHVAIADDGVSGADSNLANNVSNLTLPVAGKTPTVSPSSPGNSGSHGSGGIMAIADHEVVKVYDRSTGSLLMKFRPYGDDVEKVRVALGDVNGDGVSDIITYASGHKVRAFDSETGMRVAIAGKSSMEIFGEHGTHAPSIAAADFNGDGIADLVVGEGKGGGRVKVYDGKTGAVMSSFSPFGDTVKGIRVSVSDVNGDGIADILARQGGSEGSILVFSGATVGRPTDPLKISSFPA